MTDETKKITICAKCNNFISNKDGPRTGIWYNLFCGAVEQKTTLNVVTGAWETPNGNRHPWCQDINDGACKLFEPKKSVVDTIQAAMNRILGEA